MRFTEGTKMLALTPIAWLQNLCNTGIFGDTVVAVREPLASIACGFDVRHSIDPVVKNVSIPYMATFGNKLARQHSTWVGRVAPDSVSFMVTKYRLPIEGR